MENLSKEVLITIIKDLNKQLNEKTELCKNFVASESRENAIEQGKLIAKLQKDLQATQSDRDKYREKCREWKERCFSCQKDAQEMCNLKDKYSSMIENEAFKEYITSATTDVDTVKKRIEVAGKRLFK